MTGNNRWQQDVNAGDIELYKKVKNISLKNEMPGMLLCYYMSGIFSF